MPQYSKEFDRKVTEFARELLREQLIKCRPDEIEFFNKLHPGGIDAMSFDRMALGYHQVMASLARHKKEEEG